MRKGGVRQPSGNFLSLLDSLPITSYYLVMPSPNGSLIRSARQRRGRKLGELAEMSRVKVQHLANIESGYATASIEVLQRIADALNRSRPKDAAHLDVADLVAEQVAS